MKKILYILLLLPFCMAGCRKDASEKLDAKGYEGYIIKGKLKNVIVADGGIEQPFVMTFMADNKATLVNIDGETMLNYSVQEGKLILDDNGYFNIKNKQITDWVIAGLNITQATLVPKPATNQLRGKKFFGTIKYSGFPYDVETSLEFDANADQVTFSGGVQPLYLYTPQGNVGGYLYDAITQSKLFFMINNGKLEYTNISPGVGIAVATLNPK